MVTDHFHGGDMDMANERAQTATVGFDGSAVRGWKAPGCEVPWPLRLINRAQDGR
jgi:hypothetical protein